MTEKPDFKGYIHDVGGPTADFRRPACETAADKRAPVPTSSACFRNRVKNLQADHKDYVTASSQAPGDCRNVKKVFIRSGIRFDYVLADKDKTFLRELCQYHISGQLKVAPEHVTDAVLDKTGQTAS